MALYWRLVLLCAVMASSSAVTIFTIYGPVNGSTLSLHTGNSVNSFHSIPYVKPPVGDLRFKKPEPPEPWAEAINGRTLPAVCSQSTGMGLLWITHPGWSKFSEDCLFLDIYTPEDVAAGPYPVMVWFHGGAFESGGSIQYPGHFLAQHGVVVVTVNYRLGHLGFMSTGDSVAPGNWGLWDQVAALEFVRDTIAPFGGDPDHVTISGQSAGAASVGLLMLAESAQGLFHQAILESGSDLSYWAVNERYQRPETYTQYVAEQLGCPTEDSAAMMDCLRMVQHQNITDTKFQCTPGSFCLGFAPVVDEDFLPEHPEVLRARGVGAEVPVMHGHTTDDGSLYTYTLVPDSSDGGFNRSHFEKSLREDLIEFFAPQFPDKDESVFEAMNFYYSPHPKLDDEERNRDSFTEMITDFAFGSPGDRFMRLQTDDVYYFNLGLRSSNASNLVPEWMGVPHSGELPYVWGYPLLRKNLNVRLDSQILVDIIRWNDRDEEWTEFVNLLWTNFAKFGNPTPSPVTPPIDGAEPLTWQKFSEESAQQLLILEEEVTHVEDYRARNHAFWYQYLPYIIGLRNSSMPDPMTEAATVPVTLKPRNSLFHVANSRLRELLATRGEQIFGHMKPSLK